MSTFDDETLEVVIALKREGMTNDQIGHRLGMSEAAVRRRLQAATQRGLIENSSMVPVPPGYHMGKITRLASREGVGLQWEHLHPDQNSDVYEAIEAAIRDHVEPLRLIEQPTWTDDNLIAVYPDADLHLGMYAWKKESGENYDLDIASNLMQATTQRLFSLMPAAREALILDLGDGMHADNNSAQTERSKAHLDVDSRHDKVLHLAIELAMWKIDLALQRHEHVTYKRMRGNHDDRSAVAVEAALYWHYVHNPRVTVDRTPGYYFFHKFGRNMIAAHHGHLVAPSDMPSIMAAKEPRMWGETDNRYAYLGHFHRKRKGMALTDEAGGAIWEVFETIAPKDAWNASMGHTASRSLTGIVLDANEGEIVRYPVKVRNQ